jgi:hypothetical protein
MQVLIWMVFLASAFASRVFFGAEGRLVYSVVLFVTIVLFRRQLSIGLTHVASTLGLMKSTIEQMPLTIKLARAAAMQADAKPLAADLAAAGFVDAGAWDIPPLPRIKLALMVHTTENFLAAIETASSIGAQLNIHTLYADGGVTTFTNSKLPAPKVQRPNVTSVRMPGASVAAMLARARNERRRDGISAVGVDEAPGIYERLYAESIRYRKLKGA